MEIKENKQDEIKPNILIIDDDEATLICAKSWFDGFCKEIHVACDSQDAEAVFAKHNIDIILCDVELKTESGIGLAREYIIRFPKAIIYLWTAEIEKNYQELVYGIECVQKNGEKNSTVAPVMHLWSQKNKLSQELKEKQESIFKQLSFGGLVKLESRQCVDGLEAVELSLLRNELLHFMAVAYRNQADVGQTDINLALGHGCMAHNCLGGPCKMCLIGKISRNVTSFRAPEIVSQIPHLLTGYKSRGYLNGKLSIGYSCGNDPIYCWRELVKAIKIIDDVRELKVRHIITTIGNLKMFDEMLPMLNGREVDLYLSAHATRRLAREWLIPASKGGGSLWKMAERLSRYSSDTGRKWTYCQLLVKDFNDSPEEAWRISELLKGMPCKVKVMTVADNCLATFPKIVTREDGLTFTNILNELGLDARFRKNIGGDKAVKCGMHLATHNRNIWKYSQEKSIFLAA